MDVWISRCNKTVECSYCHEPIHLGSPMVFGKLWMRFTGNDGQPRRWVRNFRWHAKRQSDGACCWLVSGLDELSRRVFVETRGRKKLCIPKDQRDKRLALLRKRARILQRLKFIMFADPDQREVDEIVKLGGQLEDMKEEIASLGGVPKSWE